MAEVDENRSARDSGIKKQPPPRNSLDMSREREGKPLERESEREERKRMEYKRVEYGTHGSANYLN